MLKFQKLHQEFEDFKRRSIEQIQSSLDEAEDFIDHDEPGATLLWFGEHEGVRLDRLTEAQRRELLYQGRRNYTSIDLVKYCKLHEEYIVWLDEWKNRSPLSTIIWFGKYYQGYEIRKIFHEPKRWNWFLAHCAERLDDLLEIQERYYRWLERQPRRRRPVARAARIIVNHVGERLGAQDDGVASDYDQDYEADGFVVPDSEPEEEETEDDSDDDGDSDAPWNRDDQVDPADELRRELDDLDDEVFDKTSDVSGESQNPAISSGTNGDDHQNPHELSLDASDLPLPISRAQRPSPNRPLVSSSKAKRSRYYITKSSDDDMEDNNTEVDGGRGHRQDEKLPDAPSPLVDLDSDVSLPDIKDIGASSQAKQQITLPLRQQRLTRRPKLGRHFQEDWRNGTSPGTTSHAITPSPFKRRRLLRKGDIKYRPNSSSDADDNPLVYTCDDPRSDGSCAKIHSAAEIASEDEEGDDELLQNTARRRSTRNRHARFRIQSESRSSGISDAEDPEDSPNKKGQAFKEILLAEEAATTESIESCQE